MIANNYTFGKNPQILSKKSIFAYILPVATWLIILIIALAISFFFALPVFLIGLYYILLLKSYKLFIDDEGVWVFRGVNSWDQGIYGIKWSDFGEAVFIQNLDSWVFRTYTIEIKNRFKEEPIIRLEHMHNGDIAVSKINNLFMHKYRKLHQ